MFRAIWIRDPAEQIQRGSVRIRIHTPLQGNGTRDITGYTFRKVGIVNGRNVSSSLFQTNDFKIWALTHRTTEYQQYIYKKK